MLNEFDKHYLKLMKNKILSFQENEANLDSLLSITRFLEEILNALKNVDKQLKEALITEWGELEILSSVMMYQEVDIINSESKQEIAFALENMKKIIDTALNDSSLDFRQGKARGQT